MPALKALLRARNLEFATVFQGIPPYLVLNIDWGGSWFPHPGECPHYKSSLSFPTQERTQVTLLTEELIISWVGCQFRGQEIQVLIAPGRA